MQPVTSRVQNQTEASHSAESQEAVRDVIALRSPDQQHSVHGVSKLFRTLCGALARFFRFTANI